MRRSRRSLGEEVQTGAGVAERDRTYVALAEFEDACRVERFFASDKRTTRALLRVKKSNSAREKQKTREKIVFRVSSGQ
jgi:hypothetical protein